MSGKTKKKQHQDEDEEGGREPQDLTSKLVESTFSTLIGGEKKKEESTGCCPILSMTFWRKYFNVNQSDISKRLRSALFLTPAFEEVMEGHPDLYGPFWIYTTMIAVLSITANICSYLNTVGTDTVFTYNFEFIPVAASLIYGVGLFTPTAMWAICKLLFKVKVKLIQTICLFGYSETCFILICGLSMIPNTWVHWGLLIYGFLISTTFFFRNVKREMEELEPNQKYVVFGIVLGCQLTLCLMFRFYFFKLNTINTTTST